MRRHVRIASLLVLSLAAWACTSANGAPNSRPTDEPPLAVLVTHEEEVVRPDGVTQHTRYRERVIRANGRVWTERVLDPRHTRPEKAENSPGHHHAHDWSTATRLVIRDEDKAQVHLQFVVPEEREIVEVVPAEYDSVRFYPEWTEVAHLVSELDRAQLRPTPRPSPIAHARWLEDEDADRYVRVLWSDETMLALEIHAGRKDGTITRRLLAEVEPPPPTLPWDELDGFALKDVNDFRD